MPVRASICMAWVVSTCPCKSPVQVHMLSGLQLNDTQLFVASSAHTTEHNNAGHRGQSMHCLDLGVDMPARCGHVCARMHGFDGLAFGWPTHRIHPQQQTRRQTHWRVL